MRMDGVSAFTVPTNTGQSHPELEGEEEGETDVVHWKVSGLGLEFGVGYC
jgi:hypothetical protein